MGKDLVCWRCGASLREVPLPLARLAQCRACGTDLHACRMCRFYNPNLNGRCDHDMAEPAREIDLANFCHYFRPRHDAFQPRDKSRSDAARAKLQEIFGAAADAGSATPSADKPADDLTTARKKFDSLFKDK